MSKNVDNKNTFLYSPIQIKAQVSALLAYTDSTVSTTVQKTQFSKEENNETISLFCTCTGTDSRMGLLLTGCGRQKSEMPEESVKPGASETVKDAMQEATKQIDHDVTFGMPVRSFSGLFYVELMKGAQRAVDEMNEKTGRNDEIIFMDDNNELSRELSNVEDLLNMEIDVVVLVCMDPSGSVPAFEKCIAKKGYDHRYC